MTSTPRNAKSAPAGNNQKGNGNNDPPLEGNGGTLINPYDLLRGAEHNGIWLEVAEVLLQAPFVFVRLVGDKAPHEPKWWCIKETFDAHQKAQKKDAEKPEELREKANKTAADLATRLFDAIEKKRLVLAKLSHANGDYLYCSEIRIQSGETNPR